MIGAAIGHYRVVSKLGEGGMGVVYRALDTRLDREVAIKVLPVDVAQEPDRLARFEREAKTLASLNHPNIAAVYGVEAGALVMELVEGPTLGDRLTAGALPMEEAIGIAKQIAEALEAAHDKGIVHRDLKPANVKLTPDGVVKLLDFGLAKAMESSKAVAGDPMNSPTIVAASMPGVIMGTAGYMSPEQAKGQPVDRRADIWSFGVVLYEMLTGQRLFDAGSIAESIADVLRRDIDLNALPLGTPQHVKSLLSRCLDRNPRTRLRDIGEARIQLTNPAQPDTPTPLAKPARWPLALAALCALAVPAAWLLKPIPDAPLLQLEIVPPLGVAMGPVTRGQIGVAPSGDKIAYSARDREGKDRIYLRSLTEGTTVVVVGSEGGGRPFWSPDSRNIGFVANGRLKHVELASGRVVDLTDFSRALATWGSDGTIIYSSEQLMKIPAAGGAPERVLPPNSPWLPGSGSANFFPDGRTFTYHLAGNPRKLMLRTLDGKRDEVVIEGISTGATYVPNPAGGGWLLYQRTGLAARPFDYQSGKFTGEEGLLAQDVPSGPSWSVSGNGVLAYRSMRLEGEDRMMTWVGRDGAPGKSIAGPGNVFIPRISPDQESVTYTYNPGEGTGVYEYNPTRGASTKISPDARAAYSDWTPDGKNLIYTVGEELVEHPVQTGGSRRVIAKSDSSSTYRTTGISPDGKWIACAQLRNAASHIVFVARDSGKVVSIDSDQDSYTHHASFSANGKLFVFSKVTRGRWDIFVRTIPQELGGPSGKPVVWQVSTTGGTQPKWRADDKEIFYVAPDGRMMAVAVEATAETFRVGATTALFATNLGLQTGYQREYDVSSDGKRFILPLPPSGPHQEAPITVIFNWPRLLQKR